MSLAPHLGQAFSLGLCLILATLQGAQGLANCPNGCECDDDTLMVNCGEGTLDVLPIALNPAIQRLVIKNNKLKTIDSSMQFYAQLTFLDLSFNDMLTIPERSFSYHAKLQELHLDHNKIGQVSNKTFLGLSTISVLNLRGNLIAELEVSGYGVQRAGSNPQNYRLTPDGGDAMRLHCSCQIQWKSKSQAILNSNGKSI